MFLMKNTFDLFMRYVLRRRPVPRSGQATDKFDLINKIGLVTLRTYEPGGDPFDNRIEFHLTNRPGIPSGFREPNEPADIEADA